MKQRCLKKTCLLLLVGTLMLVNYPFTRYIVNAQEESTNAHSTDIEETTNTELENSKEYSIENVNETSEVEDLNITVYADEIIEVPEKAMVISGGIYYGISKEWYDNNFQNGNVIKFALTIPNNVTSIAFEGFTDTWSNDKQSKKCITNYNYDSDKTYTDKYEVVSIDFSKATNLKEIGNQAANHNTYLSGVIDLSNTKVETLAKSAFNDCPNITGVILPTTLKHIGSTSAGSVFNSCTSLKFVRTAGGDPNAIFELPQGLETIGKQSFEGCKGFPANTTVIIPESVKYVGTEAFDGSSNITKIYVMTDDASKYNGGAFKDNNGGYGLDKRLIIFKNYASKSTFNPSGFTSYKNAVTYEFTLKYDGVKEEKKLWGQAVNVSKGEDGNWFVDENYIIPDADESVPVGYTGGWIYNDAPLTNKTLLKPSGDELVLKISYVLSEPTIEFIVDDEVIESDSTYPKLNLSNNEEHTIGVKVTHPIETVEDADVKVKFEYAWTDVWKGGSQGERMEEEGFGRYNLWDNPDVTNTITIHGPEHERTNTENYSGEDYGHGYYLVEIYGYYRPASGGEWKLFYKSASTGIAYPDPDRTTNTAYMFDVVTSDPVRSPDVSFSGNSVVYGYENAEIIATVSDIDGQTNTYQWYKAIRANETTDGEIVQGANSTVLAIENGKNAGKYYYYLEVTSIKDSNGDTIKKAYPVIFTVEKAPSTVVIKTDNMDKTYDKLQVSNPLVEKTGSTSPITFIWYIKDGDTYTELATSPSDVGSYKVVARVEEDMNHGSAEAEKTFEIFKATPNLPILDVFTIKKGSKLSSISLPIGFKWLDENQISNELGIHSFKATYTPSDSHNYLSMEVDVAVNVVPALVTINHLPTISASDKTITVGEKFNPKKDVTASDTEDGDLTDKIEIVENTLDTSKVGTYYITYKVTDTKGAYTLKRITITVKDKEVPVSPSNPDDERMEVPNTGANSQINQNIMIGSMFAILLISAIVSLLYFKHHKSK